VQGVIGRAVEQNPAWKSVEPEDKNKLINKLTSQVREAAKYEAGNKMRDTAANMMGAAASKLETAAKNPNLSETSVKELKEQAGLLRKEQEELKKAPVNQLFLSMADHDVAKVYMRQAGIDPESIAGKGVMDARAQGKSDKESLEHMKMACSVAAALATGPLGGAYVVASGLAMNAQSLNEKFNAIDRAKAGEKAGTMKDGAVDRARINFLIAAVVTGGEAVGGGHVAHWAEHTFGLSKSLAEGAVSLGANSFEQAMSLEEPEN
jgi:hypothetical protein